MLRKVGSQAMDNGTESDQETHLQTAVASRAVTLMPLESLGTSLSSRGERD